jgi:chromate reductase
MDTGMMDVDAAASLVAPPSGHSVLALAGSLRRGSFNRLLLRAARDGAPGSMSVELCDSLESIPLFNEDVEAAQKHGPEPVLQLRRRVRAADGVVIATPEYNQSMPGVLKNLIDWLSRPGPDEVLAGKPVAVMGATPGMWGTRLAQYALRQTLAAVGARVMPEPALYVRNAGALFDGDGTLADSATRAQLGTLMTTFGEWIDLAGPRVNRGAAAARA